MTLGVQFMLRGKMLNCSFKRMDLYWASLHSIWRGHMAHGLDLGFYFNSLKFVSLALLLVVGLWASY